MSPKKINKKVAKKVSDVSRAPKKIEVAKKLSCVSGASKNVF